ncbi:general secretion pathway protein GspM [Pseudomonas floridensis]|uniref:General secretion pathway protein GspM n=1 Tax=Pseudomonas floridensis TaxID=1958950 RepID=A0A1X0NCU0_9PSED|nr:type II secretion system protein GspM [Pseudomonas floridensis]ORC62332.1 general secretion pathway protein GspM [Pseudomonas floridensis]
MSRSALGLAQARWRGLHLRAKGTWSGLTRRERQLISSAGLVLLGLLVWLLLIQPPLKSIAYWHTETPKLRTQSQTLDELLQQVSMPVSRVPGQDLEQALRDSLDGAGLKGRYRLEVTAPDSDSGWQLTFEQASADVVMEWLLEQPGQFSLQVTEARLQRADEPSAQVSAGRLSGIVRMDQAPGAKEAL